MQTNPVMVAFLLVSSTASEVERGGRLLCNALQSPDHVMERIVSPIPGNGNHDEMLQVQ